MDSAGLVARRVALAFLADYCVESGPALQPASSLLRRLPSLPLSSLLLLPLLLLLREASCSTARHCLHR